MKYFWISWYQPTDDHRPLTFPPNEGVLGWWGTGTRVTDGACTICAMVHAKNETDAKEIVRVDWPEAEEWRFCEETCDLNLGDRFQLVEGSWAHIRFEVHKTNLK